MEFTNTNKTILKMQICKYVSFPDFARWEYRPDDDDQTSQSDVLRKQLSIKHYAVRDPRRRRTEIRVQLETSKELDRTCA